MPDGSGSLGAKNSWPLRGLAAETRAKVTVLDPVAHAAKESLREMAAAVEGVANRLDGRFARTVRLLSECEGHVVLSGLGKSGLIGKKIAATLASTGTPSFFVHASEAFHGDLGMITDRDVVVLLSYSGETREVVELVPHLRRRGIPTVALVGDDRSNLAREVDIALDVSVDREACPNNLAPTSSTLPALAMGDVLAISLIKHRSFEAEHFAKLHPGGSLGRRFARVRDVMSKEPLPVVPSAASAKEAMVALMGARVPLVLVAEGDRLHGIVGERELRDELVNGSLETRVDELLGEGEMPVIDAEAYVADAQELMRRIDRNALVVLDADGQVCGILLER